ncbi:hypothetical protein Daesc_010486 [Daldinia eschscholtzii]|uniref:RRM domain-containing protein n=1 Tax=Daldinia eschscholtzii TaxID=292717 RepID=A0AAX6M8H2_9PEZI
MDTMDLDMEMDVDVDLVPDEPIIPEPEFQDAPGNRSPGEIVDDDTIIPGKIHIRGLDVMNPEEVKTYVAEHFSEEPMERIEWIDDSSANLLFGSKSAAARALSSLSAQDIQDVSQLPLRQLISAKPFSKRPEVMLQIRLAVTSDKKQAGAASRSRFYLLNPEYDPEERRRRSEARRYRDRDSDGYNRRRTRELRNREAEEQFDVNLYDDDEAALSRRASYSRPRRRRSYTPETSEDGYGRDSYRPGNRGKDLPRGRDSDQTMDDVANEGLAARNRDRARAIKSRISRSNRVRELFPGRSGEESGRLGDEVEDTTALLAKGIMLPLMDERNDTRATPGRKLEDRITAPGKGKLADRITSADESRDSGFNIRGAASQRSANQGFAIKGSAGKSAKELFPEKLGANAGKELFADRIEGRSRQRQRAGDLFD